MKTAIPCFLLVAVFLVYIAPVFSQPLATAPNSTVIDSQRMEVLKNIQARNEDRILALKGVVGIGIGLAENGKDLCFVVYVKKSTAQLRAKLAEGIEGVPVRAVESGEIIAY